MSHSPGSDKGADTTKVLAEIGERTVDPDSIQGSVAAADVSMDASTASDNGATGSKPAVSGSTRATVLVLMAVVAVAVPILLLVSFHGDPMSQVNIMSLSICLYIFAFLMRISRDRLLLIECVRLSYIPLLAICLAPVVGSATATFILFFSIVWAAGNLGYSLAVHRVLKGTELDVHKHFPSFHTEKRFKELSFNMYVAAPFAVLVWTLLLVIIINVQPLNDELDIMFILSYFGWIHAAVWVIFIMAELPVRGVILREQMPELLPALVPWMLISPAVSFISHILSIMCNLLLVTILVAFLWYNVAIYICFLEIVTAREENAPVGESMDLMTALQLVMKKSGAHDGLVKGLDEAVEAIKKHAAQICVLAEDCDQPDQAKLVKALCAEHKVHLITVPSAETLGEWAGLSKIDPEGKARKVAGCSCVVVTDYGEESEGINIVQDYVKSH